MADIEERYASLAERAGLPAGELESWIASIPAFPAQREMTHRTFERDAEASSAFLRTGDRLLQRLPPRPRRNEAEAHMGEMLKERAREMRTAFLRAYREYVYRALTDDFRSFIRAEDLVYGAAERFPGLTPAREAVGAEAALRQGDKEGLEIDQGIFFSMILSHPRTGAHLVQAMLRPRPDSLARLATFRRDGRVDLGTAVVERKGRAGYLSFHNPRFLNAEDDSTTDALEIGVDLILLDPTIDVGVLRGEPVDHPRYSGRRVFNAGINLTRLYHGKISYLFYITRDLGYVNKIYRGLAPETFYPEEPERTEEKPWIAAVEAFAIGGGCQLLLVMDHVLAEEGTHFSLPARKEGIIPGAANLRLRRYVGDRLARRAILFDHQFRAGSPDAALLCDDVVAAGDMDAALERAVATVTDSGLVSAAGNRKALRVGEEPLTAFQSYMATYAREQAYCHFSPALIRNLETNWNAKERRAE